MKNRFPTFLRCQSPSLSISRRLLRSEWKFTVLPRLTSDARHFTSQSSGKESSNFPLSPRRCLSTSSHRHSIRRSLQTKWKDLFSFVAPSLPLHFPPTAFVSHRLGRQSLLHLDCSFSSAVEEVSLSCADCLQGGSINDEASTDFTLLIHIRRTMQCAHAGCTARRLRIPSRSNCLRPSWNEGSVNVASR